MPRIRQRANVYRNEDFAKEVGARLKYLGLRQYDLAEHLGVSQAAVSKMLHDPGKIPAERLREIILFLQLEPRAILIFFGYPKKAIDKAV